MLTPVAFIMAFAIAPACGDLHKVQQTFSADKDLLDPLLRQKMLSTKGMSGARGIL